ncbi:MAG: pyruvate kinase [Bacteroidetes bacterium]|jgi:pyruvate kinase|nr:pyruvate kinase [Bacteroidota bacterium]
MIQFNKTKIITTLGPATNSREMIWNLIKAGADVMRINASHGDHQFLKAIVDNVRSINEEENLNIALLLDLQGPKIRIGEIESGECVIKDKETFVLTAGEVIGNSEKATIRYSHFSSDVKKGDIVLIDDGKLKLEVKKVEANGDVVTQVINGGVLMSRKGVNLPFTKISIPSITEKDYDDIAFAVENDIEWIGLSFVRTAQDILDLKKIIKDHGKPMRVIAKIEKPEAVRNMDEIIAVADGIMVARGDLGVEIDLAQVPIIQKKLVQKSRAAGIPVIIATQMMESMITNFRPTRAEANDVGNAVFDGADALMLSAETSVGKFPVETVHSMRRIIQAIEYDQSIYYRMNAPDKHSKTFISDTLCYHAVELAQQSGAKAIAAMTHSGYTAFKISSQRPKAGIFIFTDYKPILNTLNLVWGVRGLYYNKYISTDQTIDDIKNTLKKDGYIDTGDVIVHVASTPLQNRSRANTIKINVVD